MKDSHPNQSGFVKDMSWYLIGTIIPMGVGFIKTPVFTRYFTPEEFGYLGLDHHHLFVYFGFLLFLAFRVPVEIL